MPRFGPTSLIITNKTTQDCLGMRAFGYTLKYLPGSIQMGSKMNNDPSNSYQSYMHTKQARNQLELDECL
jgi:hypothetical protein